jgi:hypothetical protein
MHDFPVGSPEAKAWARYLALVKITDEQAAASRKEFEEGVDDEVLKKSVYEALQLD